MRKLTGSVLFLFADILQIGHFGTTRSSEGRKAHRSYYSTASKMQRLSSAAQAQYFEGRSLIFRLNQDISLEIRKINLRRKFSVKCEKSHEALSLVFSNKQLQFVIRITILFVT